MAKENYNLRLMKRKGEASVFSWSGLRRNQAVRSKVGEIMAGMI